MRVLLLFSLLLSATLAGCLGDDDSSPEPLDSQSPPSDPSVGTEASGEDPEGGPEGGDTSTAAPMNDTGPILDEPVELASATLKWHDEEADFLAPYAMATQSVASRCMEGGEEAHPYFTNLHVSERAEVNPIPVGARSLEVTLDWTDQDYLGDSLVLAYFEDDEWHMSDYLPKGTSIVDIQDVTKKTRPDLWLCVWGEDGPEDEPEDIQTLDPRWFTGSVTFTLRALGTDA